MNRGFWRGRRVFLTGHTGFKGTWLDRWLALMGADVTGYSLPDDIRDLSSLRSAMSAADPEVIFHLAAQALVRVSYEDPVTTFTSNVTGTVHVLESLRELPSARVAILVTSDKCYANDGQPRAFREDDRLGGHDPYSASKAAAELVIDSYRHAFFSSSGAPRIVSVRAGNVIGGGDLARDRLVPDLVSAFREGRPARLRYPEATRSWQFVLDALHGYLLAAERAYAGDDVPASLNFGPDAGAARTVAWMADAVAARWGERASWIAPGETHPPEAQTLTLDSSLAQRVLGWRPLLDTEAAVQWTTDWYRSSRDLTVEQITRYAEMLAS